MFVCVCVCVCVCVQLCKRVCLYASTHVPRYVYACSSVFAHVWVCVQLCKRVCLCVYTRMYQAMCMCAAGYARARVCVWWWWAHPFWRVRGARTQALPRLSPPDLRFPFHPRSHWQAAPTPYPLTRYTCWFESDTCTLWAAVQRGAAHTGTSFVLPFISRGRISSTMSAWVAMHIRTLPTLTLTC